MRGGEMEIGREGEREGEGGREGGREGRREKERVEKKRLIREQKKRLI